MPGRPSYIPCIPAVEVAETMPEKRQEKRMIRGVKLVSIPVSNQDVSLKFYTEKMGFKVATDQPMGPGQRWIELSIPGAETAIDRIRGP